MIQKKRKIKKLLFKSKKNISVMAVKYADQAELVDPFNPLPNFAHILKRTETGIDNLLLDNVPPTPHFSDTPTSLN